MHFCKNISQNFLKLIQTYKNKNRKQMTFLNKINKNWLETVLAKLSRVRLFNLLNKILLVLSGRLARVISIRFTVKCFWILVNQNRYLRSTEIRNISTAFLWKLFSVLITRTLVVQLVPNIWIPTLAVEPENTLANYMCGTT